MNKTDLEAEYLFLKGLRFGDRRNIDDNAAELHLFLP